MNSTLNSVHVLLYSDGWKKHSAKSVREVKLKKAAFSMLRMNRYIVGSWSNNNNVSTSATNEMRAWSVYEQKKADWRPSQAVAMSSLTSAFPTCHISTPTTFSDTSHNPQSLSTSYLSRRFTNHMHSIESFTPQLVTTLDFSEWMTSNCAGRITLGFTPPTSSVTNFRVRLHYVYWIYGRSMYENMRTSTRPLHPLAKDVRRLGSISTAHPLQQA